MEHPYAEPPFQSEALTDGTVRVRRAGAPERYCNIPMFLRFNPAAADPLLIRIHRLAAACEVWRGRARPSFQARLILGHQPWCGDLGCLVMNASRDGIHFLCTAQRETVVVAGNLWASHADLPTLTTVIVRASGISAHQAMGIAGRGRAEGLAECRTRMADLSPRQLLKSPPPLQRAA